eukprot:1403654-Rhodomonas_salina.1
MIESPGPASAPFCHEACSPSPSPSPSHASCGFLRLISQDIHTFHAHSRLPSPHPHRASHSALLAGRQRSFHDMPCYMTSPSLPPHGHACLHLKPRPISSEQCGCLHLLTFGARACVGRKEAAEHAAAEAQFQDNWLAQMRKMAPSS